jgi:hypothetical protein
VEMLMTKYFDNVNEHTKHLIDGVSVATVMGTLMSWLPAIAALFTIIWTAIRIYETKTIQGWIKKNAK